tara:strand:- start:7204 stop:7527 length:324 start_codon:yes stop_codon:yes gene_type:complete
MVQTVKSSAAELSADVNDQMAVLREDIANLTAAVGNYGKAQGLQLKSVAQQKAANVAQSGAETAAAVRKSAEIAYSDAESAVRANPAAAVGIAAGLGFLVGMIATRR